MPVLLVLKNHILKIPGTELLKGNDVAILNKWLKWAWFEKVTCEQRLKEGSWSCEYLEEELPMQEPWDKTMSDMFKDSKETSVAGAEWMKKNRRLKFKRFMGLDCIGLRKSSRGFGESSA